MSHSCELSSSWVCSLGLQETIMDPVLLQIALTAVLFPAISVLLIDHHWLWELSDKLTAVLIVFILCCMLASNLTSWYLLRNTKTTPNRSVPFASHILSYPASHTCLACRGDDDALLAALVAYKNQGIDILNLPVRKY